MFDQELSIDIKDINESNLYANVYLDDEMKFDIKFDRETNNVIVNNLDLNGGFKIPVTVFYMVEMMMKFYYSGFINSDKIYYNKNMSFFKNI